MPPAEKLSDIAIQRALGALPGWSRKGDTLVRSYQRPTFLDGIAFVQRIAMEAEDLDHHPDVDIRYTTIHIALSTHSAGGITELDLELARRIDAAAG
jgi:4a-hydroxytetrahydrobiopterin dehydratase